SHADDLHRELRKCAHPSDRIVVEIVLRKRVDHSTRQLAVTQPVGEKLIRRDDDRAGCVGHFILDSSTCCSATFRHPGGVNSTRHQTETWENVESKGAFR